MLEGKIADPWSLAPLMPATDLGDRDAADVTGLDTSVRDRRRPERLGAFIKVSELLRREDPDGPRPPDACQKADAAMGFMARFIGERLPAPDPAMGRPGPVCPYARRGVRLGGIRIADCDASDDEADLVMRAMDYARALFLRWNTLAYRNVPPVFRSLVVTFSAMSNDKGARIIETVQRRLKTDYVEVGLMIGQFYPGCPEGGIYNPEFRPLDAPVVSLAVRHMIASDAPFMLDDDRYLRAFLDRFGEAGHWQAEVARNRVEQRHAAIRAKERPDPAR